MHGPFENARARDQVVAALDYAAYPGLAILIDGRGEVVARAGSLIGSDFSALAGVIARADELLVEYDHNPATGPVHRVPSTSLPRGSLPEQQTVLYSALPRGFRLCVVAPVVVSADDVHGRLLRTRERLLRMMAGPPSSGGTDMGGPGERADLFWAEVPPPGER